MKALVIGGDSNLGKALRWALSRKLDEVIWTTRRPLDCVSLCGLHEAVVPLDLLDPRLPSEPVMETESWVVYLMAAITGVVPAERRPDAWRINAEAPVALALQAHARGWHVVSMSSGTVELAPHSASAMQKAYVDLAVTMLGGCVVRPLPRVPESKYAELAELLVDVGERRHVGTVRWDG